MKQIVTAVVGAVVIVGCGGESPMAPSATPDPSLRPSAVVASAQPQFNDLVVPFSFSTDCPQGFTLVNNGVARIHETIYVDGSGNPLRSRSQFIIRATAVNSVTGKTLRNDSQFTIFADFATGETTIAGAQMHIVDSGRGILVRDAGRITFDAAGNVIFEAGEHDFSNGDSDALSCEILA